MAKLTKRLMFRMSDEDDAFLEQESERIGVDKSDVIRMMIRRARAGNILDSIPNGAVITDPVVARDVANAIQMQADDELAALEASEPRAEEVEVPADDDEPDYYEPEPTYQQSAAYLSPDEPSLRPVGVTDSGKPYDAAGNARVQRHKHLYGNQFGGGYVARAGR